jgi:hypothetical protein
LLQDQVHLLCTSPKPLCKCIYFAQVLNHCPFFSKSEKNQCPKSDWAFFHITYLVTTKCRAIANVDAWKHNNSLACVFSAQLSKIEEVFIMSATCVSPMPTHNQYICALRKHVASKILCRNTEVQNCKWQRAKGLQCKHVKELVRILCTRIENKQDVLLCEAKKL